MNKVYIPLKKKKKYLELGQKFISRRVFWSQLARILDFIFNNYSSIANPSLYVCGDGVYLCKIKKNMVSCYAVADKLLVEWLPRELWQLQKQRMQILRNSFLPRKILLIENYSTVTHQPKAVF